MNCAKCGEPVTDAMTIEKLREGLPADLRGMTPLVTHELCPRDREAAAAAERAGRHFECRVQIVEVFPDTDPDGGGHLSWTAAPGRAVEPRTLFDFVVSERAATLDAAMRPLALGLGVKWQRAETQTGVADADALQAQS